MHAVLPLLESTGFPPLRRTRIETVQVNVGYRCNQSCLHCHVNAGPRRTEEMSRETADLVLEFLRTSGAGTLDLTGGAPELHAPFRYLVDSARGLGVRVMDRCNLTVLEEPDQVEAGLAEFLASREVEVVASLPCYEEDNVDGQRGKGVFERSIAGLRRLNRLGYGEPGSGLELQLVFNPQGPVLPPPQRDLEAEYRRRLGERHGVRFNRLLVLANMPIGRFGSTLVSRREFEPYMATLRAAHREANLDTVMCRNLVSVDWRGYVYDCDFNQMLGLGLRRPEVSGRAHLADLIGRDLAGNPIAVRGHCYGCTAGQGSSCGGALDGGARNGGALV